MKLPDSFHNRLTYIGATIAAAALVLMFFIFILSTFFHAGGNYMGLILYMALPGLLIFGLLLIPIGMRIRAKKIKKMIAKDINSKLVIDLNIKKHRNAAIIFILGSIAFFILTAIGSYEAFHYTESNKFCGTLCHQVMDPEYATYQTSAHARVKCVECHIGPGVDWFVQSKLSGLYQVYAVVTNKYPRPIPTPIKSLRPARETCEQCHWPDKFYPNRIRNEKHYLADSLNTEWNIAYRMKIGPDHSSQGTSEGIHWHINSNIKIEYISMTDARDYIPWIRQINLLTGDTIIYQDIIDPMDEETLAESTTRSMDCMDCHNRPSHTFLTPQDFIDQAIAKGDILIQIPEIKKIAMEVFLDPFENSDTAYQIIESMITEFYREKYPEVFSKNKDIIDKNITGISDVFSQNMFPEMRADWDQYPNHIGHIEYNGCFRCHDDNHVSTSGQKIRKDCNLCHTILQQGSGDQKESAPFNSSLEFKHPTDIEGSWKEDLCADCHRYLYL